MGRGDAAALGGLMTEAQAAMDTHAGPVCAELQAPLLHKASRWGRGQGSRGSRTGAAFKTFDVALRFAILGSTPITHLRCQAPELTT